MNRIITDYLDNTASRFPDKMAFDDDTREVTFSRVRDEALKVAEALTDADIRKKPVAVLMDKKVECINAILGVAYSGNFYTVLDVHMPEARMRKILDVLEPEAIITDEEHKEQACSLAEDEMIVLYEDAMNLTPDEGRLAAVRESISPDETLYVLFTSGSTGVPKGVMISHSNVMPYIEGLREDFDINENTIFANQAPFYFIMSGFEIYMAIYTGASCYIIPKRMFSFPVMLLNYLKERRVNTLYWVPSILCLLANFRALPEVHLDDLKLVIFGGEVMPSKQLNMWRREYPDVIFVNGYGPTEMTDFISYYVVDREIDDNESLPIGKCVSYMKILLLDDSGHEVEEGQIGELCGYGPNTAGGYYNMPEKTAEVFTPDPTDPDSGRIIYHTGDLARVDERGDLIYMGRKDFQIKHMGHRIELGEIETAVSALDGIMQNCCHYDTKRSKIVLFYTGSLTEDEIDEQLRKVIPDYMIPNRMEKLAQMPLNLNGKIDRAALKEQI